LGFLFVARNGSPMHIASMPPSLRPHAPFAELLKLSPASVSDEYHAERSGKRWVPSVVEVA